MSDSVSVVHRRMTLDGYEVFYREAGPLNAPVLLLPHGYPCSSYAYRALMPRLADRWRTIAPDLPGFGYSATPEAFVYGFDGYARFLQRFADALELRRYALYLHDYGTWIGLRLAMARPHAVSALIIQNGDIYRDTMGPQYEALLAYFDEPTPEHRARLAEAVSEEGYREEFLNHVSDDVAARIAPDLWKLHWSLTTDRRREIALKLMDALEENLAWFPRYQAWLREHRPPALILWGPTDRFMPEPAARAYLRDLPDAALHVFDEGGHWLLETHLDEVVPLIRDFLGQQLSA